MCRNKCCVGWCLAYCKHLKWVICTEYFRGLCDCCTFCNQGCERHQQDWSFWRWSASWLKRGWSLECCFYENLIFGIWFMRRRVAREYGSLRFAKVPRLWRPYMLYSFCFWDVISLLEIRKTLQMEIYTAILVYRVLPKSLEQILVVIKAELK